MKSTTKYNSKTKSVSLRTYCADYIQRLNTVSLHTQWKRRAAYAAATATLATGMFLGTVTTSQAQIPCAPEFIPQGIVSVPIVNANLDNASYYTRPTYADIDGDGDFDVFIGEAGSKGATTISFYRNTGTASAPAYAAVTTNPFGMAGIGNLAYVTPTFVDIDGDGDLDMFVGTENDDIRYYQNTGTSTAPTFGASVTNPFGITTAGLSYTAPTFTDIDNDGDQDMFVGDLFGNVRFYRNTGGRTAPAFAAPVTNAFGSIDVGFNSIPAFTDLDGDGDQDMMVGEFTNGNFNYFQNTGSATAPAFAALASNPFDIIPTDDLTGYGNSTPAFADIDNDGDMDMFSGINKKDAPVIEYNNAGTNTQPDFLEVPYNLPLVDSYAAPAFADIDGDGDLDVFVGNGDGNVTFAENIGGAGNTPDYASGSLLVSVAGIEANPTLTDLDGDGDYDMLVGSSNGNYFYFRNDGNATAPNFVLQGQNPFGLIDAGTYAAPQFTDFDNDGDMDIFSGRGGAELWYFQNTGTAQAPAFAAPVANGFGITGIPTFNKVTLGDIDGDGDKDMFIGGGEDVFFHLNTGSVSAPNFAAPLTNPFGIQDLGAWYNPELVDVDNDGSLELFVGENGLGLTRPYKNLTILPTISLAATGRFSACNTELVDAVIGNYPADQVTVTWYNALTRLEIGTGIEFNPEVLGVRGSYYAIVVSANGCKVTSSIGNYEPVIPPSTFTLSGQASYNSAFLDWTRNGECDATIREYEVYADPGGFGSYFLVGYSQTATYEAVGLINGEKVTFKIRPIYTNGTYGLYSNTVIVKPSIILGEENNEKAGFAFFPNPNNGEFNLRLQDGSASATVSVTSLSGQRVYTTTLNATQTSINLGNVASGMYIVRVETTQGTYQQKVSVVR